MNVVVAVIVENTLDQAVNQKQDLLKKQEEEKQVACHKIYEVFQEADADGNGELTKDEFLQSLKRADVTRHLQEVGIDVRQAENLFDILDYDESGNIDAQEFIEGVLTARGEAKAKDILSVQCDVWRAEQKMKKSVRNAKFDVNSRLRKLGLELHSAAEEAEKMKNDLLEGLGLEEWQTKNLRMVTNQP